MPPRPSSRISSYPAIEPPGRGPPTPCAPARQRLAAGPRPAPRPPGRPLVAFEGPMDLEEVADLLRELREPLRGILPARASRPTPRGASLRRRGGRGGCPGPRGASANSPAQVVLDGGSARLANGDGACPPGAARSAFERGPSASAPSLGSRTWRRLTHRAPRPDRAAGRPGPPPLASRTRSASGAAAEFRGDLGPARPSVAAFEQRTAPRASSRLRASSRSSRAAIWRLGLAPVAGQSSTAAPRLTRP